MRNQQLKIVLMGVLILLSLGLGVLGSKLHTEYGVVVDKTRLLMIGSTLFGASAVIFVILVAIVFWPNRSNAEELDHQE